ncbi:MAG: hypothetical protein GWN00_25620, partial [Aliifodinibius sp.]|nr:hypothetical protein [Fodinibius sp.]NIV14226.1 hypothetical protein [Fodinibius sp.]NIY28054.1 hypothetical protein [Fodinibius sp.]
LLRYFSAIERKYEAEEIVSQGFSGILKNIKSTLSDKDSEDILEVYLSSVDTISKRFPEEQVWIQKEERFAAQPEDPVWIALGKGGKNTVRGISKVGYGAVQSLKSIFTGNKKAYPEWEQRIPLDKVVEFHLMDDESVLKWGHILERVQLDLIRDIEDLLVRGNDEQQALDLSAFVADQKNRLEERKADLLDRIEKAFNSRQTQIIEDIEKVGTLEWNSAFFDSERLKTKKEKISNLFHTQREQWQRVQRVFFQRTEDVVQFLKLRSEIEEEVSKFKGAFEDIFRESLIAPLGEYSVNLEQAIDKVSQG